MEDLKRLRAVVEGFRRDPDGGMDGLLGAVRELRRRWAAGRASAEVAEILKDAPLLMDDRPSVIAMLAELAEPTPDSEAELGHDTTSSISGRSLGGPPRRLAPTAAS